jgi:hypothetical protein
VYTDLGLAGAERLFPIGDVMADDPADIRLRAWALLEGWSTADPNAKDLADRIKPWSFETRLKFADKLANWALGVELKKPAE